MTSWDCIMGFTLAHGWGGGGQHPKRTSHPPPLLARVPLRPKERLPGECPRNARGMTAKRHSLAQTARL